MSVVGSVESLRRYPVKSMRGESLTEAFVGFAGVYGDRLFAFASSARPKGFPYLTGREQQEMILYRPTFRHPQLAGAPPNLAEAEAIEPGVTPVVADPADLAVDVETTSGQTLSVDDPALRELLDIGEDLTLVRSDRALTDCRPVSLFALQTARQLAGELGRPIDERRFRANIYADMPEQDGFGEDAFLDRRLRIGSKLILTVVERDPRCAMISMDPDTAEREPAVLRQVAQAHDGNAGVYGVVLAEGSVRPGDEIELLD